MKIAVIGGGLVGLATAYKLSRHLPSARLTLLEKEGAFGRHQSTHNSGVLHAGLYYKPGTLRARLAVAGIREMINFCHEHGVTHEVCGKVVVATDESELGRLRTLFERGKQNGLKGLAWLDAAGLREREPHAAGIAAVHVPEEGIVDYGGVVDRLVELNRRQGAELITGAKVMSLHRAGGGWRVCHGAGETPADFIVTCAGLHADRVSQLAGERRRTHIVPFRGEYYRLKRERQHLVRNLIYPVPDPQFPFLGVHFTRLALGGVEAGPNAVLALAREGYRKSDIAPGELLDALTFPGLWRFVGRHRRMCFEEVRRSFSKELFCASLQRLVPAVNLADLETGGAGVRAQAMTFDGTIVQDFDLIERANALHVLSAPSPAATACLAIGEEIAARVAAQVAAGSPRA